MSDLIRITNHPTDEQLLLVHVPPHLSRQMGQFPHARWLPSLKAYAVHTAAEAGLNATISYIGAHAIDERLTHPTNQPQPLRMPECTHCGQPARHDAQPARCPACGEPWRPAYRGTAHHHHGGVTQTCPTCSHTQHGRFAHCGKCGAAIPADPPQGHVQLPRRKLRDPLPLSQTVPETVAQLTTDDPPPAPLCPDCGWPLDSQDHETACEEDPDEPPF